MVCFKPSSQFVSEMVGFDDNLALSRLLSYRLESLIHLIIWLVGAFSCFVLRIKAIRPVGTAGANTNFSSLTYRLNFTLS